MNKRRPWCQSKPRLCILSLLASGDRQSYKHYWYQSNDVWCCIYVSANRDIVDSCNGLSPIWRQSITCTNADNFSNGALVTTFSEVWAHTFCHENIFENDFCKTAHILVRSQYDKHHKIHYKKAVHLSKTKYEFAQSLMCIEYMYI